MSRRTTEILVGVVTMLALVLLVAITVNLKSSTLFSRKYPIIAYFKDVKRLEEGAPVYVHGVMRGDVRDIDATQRADFPVRVTMMLARDVALHDGAQPRIITAGMIGETQINIDDPHPTGPALPAGATLIGVSIMDINDLLAQSPGLVEDIQASVAAVREFLSDSNNREALTKIVNSVSSLTTTLNERLTANAEDIDQAIGNVRTATEQLNRALTRADSAITTVGRNLAQASGRLNAALADVGTTAGKVLGNLNSATQQLEAAAGRANKFLDTAEQILEENRAQARKAVEGIAAASVQLSRILERINEGQGTLGEVLIGPKSYESLTTSVERLNKSMEIVSRLLDGFDRWFTGSGPRDSTVDIPYEVLPPGPR